MTFRDWLVVLRQTLLSLQVRLLLGLALSQIGVATVIYHFVEKWSWVDAFYFSVITIATVGYGDLSPQTNTGKLFTVLYIMLGIGIFVTATTIFASQFLTIAKSQILKQDEPPQSL